MKTRRKENITIFLYALYVVVYLITLRMYGMGDSHSRVRYYLLAFNVLVGLLMMKRNNKLSKLFKELYSKEVLYILGTGLLFLLVSIFKASQYGVWLNVRTLVQISLFVLPALYAFILINILPMEKIFNLMKYTLIASIVVYLSEPQHTILSFFDIDNWLNITFTNAFIESSLCSSIFVHLYLFFSYYDIKLNRNNKMIKMCSAISFAFSILCFKRLSVLFVILLSVYKFSIFYFRKVNVDQKLPKYSYIVIAIIFTVLTYFYTKFMNGQIFKEVDLYKFTTGRDYILSLWRMHNFRSYGYGTSMLIIGRYLEMDLIQIYLELGLVTLFCFCFSFFKQTKNVLYSIIILVYEFLNLLTASSLPSSLTWIIIFITITCIGSGKTKELKLKGEQ